MRMSAPFMCEASSEATKAMAAAMPSGVPKPPSGVTRLSSLMSAPSGRWKAPVMGVSMAPGLMLLARRPALAYSTARARVRARTPPLEAA